MELVNLGTDPVKGSNDRNGFKTAYRATVEVTVFGLSGSGTSFSDTGFGDAVDYTGSTLGIHELASKEAVSDAIKRGLKNFGDQFGLGLYSAERRADVDKRRKVGASLAAMKKEVFKLAEQKLGSKPDKASDVAKVFGVKVADLTDEVTIRGILVAEGVL